VEAVAFVEPGCVTGLDNENNTLKKVIFAKAGLGDELDIEIGPKSEQDRDDDGDGSTRRDDCDDANAAVFPGAVEICSDRLDNNCNGFTDCADVGCQPNGKCSPTDSTSSCDMRADGSWYCKTDKEICDDGQDNNGDGKKDCEEDSCANQACSDGLGCTTGDTCTSKKCTPTGTKQCDENKGQCFKPGTCIEGENGVGNCQYPSQPTTVACDAGPCTTGSRCDGNGGCNMVNDCAAGSSICRIGSCNANNTCNYTDVAEPIACPTANDPGFCSAGMCKPAFVNSTLNEPIGVGLPANDLIIPEGCTMTIDTLGFGMTGTPGVPVFAGGANCKAPAGGVEVNQIQYLNNVTSPRQYLVLIRAKNIDISGKIEVKGRRPLALFSSGNITLSSTGIIDARGAAEPLPISQRNMAYCQRTGDGTQNRNAVSGGSGGSFNGTGGVGGSAKASGDTSDSPLPSQGSSNALVTGCPGGNGGGAVSGGVFGAGGSGGGAVQLFSRRTLQVDGKIYAFGAGGNAGSRANTIGGGGGGSGGFIALDAPVINIGAAAKLIAVGGGGGAGDANSGSSSTGDDGTAPAGGTSGVGSIGAGGSGAGSVGGFDSFAVNGGSASTSGGGGSIATAGGGGGALGVVQVNAVKCKKPTLGPIIAPTQKLYSGSATCQP
jgi:Putative metal-binding motif